MLAAGVVLGVGAAAAEAGVLITPTNPPNASSMTLFEWHIDNITPVGQGGTLISVDLQVVPKTGLAPLGFDGGFTSTNGNVFHQEHPFQDSVAPPVAETPDLSDPFELGLGPSTVDTHFLGAQTPAGQTFQDGDWFAIEQPDEDGIDASLEPGNFGNASQKVFGSFLSAEVARLGGTGTWDLVQLVVPNPEPGMTTPVSVSGRVVAFDAVAEDTFSEQFDFAFEIAHIDTFVLGDMNGDLVVNNLDIVPFVTALVDPTGYAAQFPLLDPNARGDINQMNGLNNLDIVPFVNLLTADPLVDSALVLEQLQSAGLISVPEPSAVAVLMATLLSGLSVRRRRLG